MGAGVDFGRQPRQGSRARQFQRQVDAALDRRQHAQVVQADAARQFRHLRVELVRRIRVQHEPHLGRVRAGDAVARQQQTLGPLRAGQVRPHHVGRRSQ
ncbi:hypothetical protein D9M69_648980 [compost metagenome]